MPTLLPFMWDGHSAVTPMCHTSALEEPGLCLGALPDPRLPWVQQTSVGLDRPECGSSVAGLPIDDQLRWSPLPHAQEYGPVLAGRRGRLASTGRAMPSRSGGTDGQRCLDTGDVAQGDSGQKRAEATCTICGVHERER